VYYNYFVIKLLPDSYNYAALFYSTIIILRIYLAIQNQYFGLREDKGK